MGHEYSLSTKSVEREVSQSLSEDRVITLLSAFFGGLAMLLASIGLYGLTSYNVTRRTREIGLPTALGAQPQEVRWYVIRSALGLALSGIALGIPCALLGARLLASMLFEVPADDPPALALVSLLLLGVAFLATYLPARRASRIDPMAALRTE